MSKFFFLINVNQHLQSLLVGIKVFSNLLKLEKLCQIHFFIQPSESKVSMTLFYKGIYVSKIASCMS